MGFNISPIDRVSNTHTYMQKQGQTSYSDSPYSSYSPLASFNVMPLSVLSHRAPFITNAAETIIIHKELGLLKVILQETIHAQCQCLRSLQEVIWGEKERDDGCTIPSTHLRAFKLIPAAVAAAALVNIAFHKPQCPLPMVKVTIISPHSLLC